MGNQFLRVVVLSANVSPLCNYCVKEAKHLANLQNLNLPTHKMGGNYGSIEFVIKKTDSPV